MANENNASVEDVASSRPYKTEPQIPLNAREDIGRTQPTTREKSGAAQVSAAQNRHALAMSIAEHL